MKPEVTIHTQPGTTGQARKWLSDTLFYEAERIVSVFPAVCIGFSSKNNRNPKVVGLHLKL